MTTADRLMLDGERRVLLRQLRKSFGTIPAEVEQRIAGAGAAELEACSERILEASSLDEVFATDGE